MSVWNTVKVYLVEAFWPWFKEYAWPVIRKHLLELIDFLVGILKEKVKSRVSENAESQVHDFEQKASEAERAAMDSLDRNEIEKLKQEAKIWREATERLKKDNAKLQKDLDEVIAKSSKDAVDSIEAIELGLDSNDNNTILSIDGNKKNLPKIE
ncbi:hypothetical protein KIH87_11730 [Paraneptunicella aestuarii]|uniref:hypothetical protein n=1 Tax=Paraneptunicella aestuarii TaxID=2831148 RepID=UPI001E62A06F|nr:hypothetical protein [Paraneptunicella aestuarii]UAA37384.1 hypothetical protein KIH87_11730 [Paraneptunicella aestuarii]